MLNSRRGLPKWTASYHDTVVWCCSAMTISEDLIVEIMLDIVMKVMDMEIDQAVDGVTDMVADRTDFSDNVTLVSEDDDLRLY